MKIPEDENWVRYNFYKINKFIFWKRYNDGISLVCSCFVIGVYKAAGMFNGLDI